MSDPDNDPYRVQLSTTAQPWLPQEFYAATAIFLALNSVRILSIEAVNAGKSGGGTNPDGSYWGTPFTPWGLQNAEVGATFKDGTIVWKVIGVQPLQSPAVLPKENAYGGTGSFVQSTAIGGTPVGFLNYIPPTFFEPLIHREWDTFEHYWMEVLRYPSMLYAVEIIFNAEIYLSGVGQVPEHMIGGIPQFANFTGHEFRHIKKEVAEIADRLGIQPVTMKNARLQLPNMVYISNPRVPKPGTRGQGERGGKFSNL